MFPLIKESFRKEGIVTPEKIITLLRENSIPQIALSRQSGVNTCTLSNWLRGYAAISDCQQDEIVLALNAMLELADESPTPIDWRQAPRLKPLIDEKVAGYRRERSAELHQKFVEGIA